MDIEQIAVDAVSAHFTRIDRTIIEIASKDRTPFTDGHIDLYKSKPRKSDFEGRIPIQVKGKIWRKSKFPDECSYAVPLVDAQGYLGLHGVLFFVVLIDPKKNRHAVYARMLTPNWLRAFVLEAENKGTRTMRLEKIPKQDDLKIALVNFALKARDETEPVALDPALIELGATLTVYSPKSLDFNRRLNLSYSLKETLDYSLFVETANGLTASVDGMTEIVPSEYVEHELGYSVTAGDECFYHPLGRRVDVNKFRIHPSKCLTIDLTLESSSVIGQVSITDTSSFKDYLKSLKFFLAAAGRRALEINGRPLPFSIDKGDFLEPLRARLSQLSRFNEVFDALRIDADLVSMCEIDQKAQSELEAVYRGLIAGERLPALEKNSGRIAIRIGNWVIELMCSYHEEDDSWELVNLFSPDSRLKLAVSLTSADGEESAHLATPYDMLSRNDFPNRLNLNLDSLVSRYEGLPEGPTRYELGTRTVLELIASADLSELRSLEFLESARSLNSWLLSRDPNNGVFRINAWQISARFEGLSNSERTEVFEMMSDGAIPGYSRPLVAYVCAILLEDLTATSYWEGRLAQDEMDLLEGWPISNLRRLATEEGRMIVSTSDSDA